MKELQFRFRLATYFAWLGIFILLFRLWFLQVVHGSYYRNKSENNRTRAIRVEAPRGIVYDRFGKVIVRNRPSFNLAILTEDVKNVNQTLEKIAGILKLDSKKLIEDFKSSKKNYRKFEPQVAIHDISHEDLARVEARGYSLPGVITTVEPARVYPYDNFASQLLGYTREISPEQLKELKNEKYRPGDQTGQSGLEVSQEKLLKGSPGYLQVEVDARGRRRSQLGVVDIVPGKDLYLTLDLELQKIAEEQMQGKRGAIVAMEPNTGEILALVSAPGYDPNLFSGNISNQGWKALVDDPGKPFRNRAVSSAYPPGSTSKLLWAITGLEKGIINENTLFNCPGYYKIKKRRFHCHKRAGHGKVNVSKAIKVSCNAFFYQLGHKLGIDNLSEYLNKFGFGKKTGIDLLAEKPATAPSRQWKKKRLNERWYDGDTIPVSIGQGYFTTTPLQLASMLSTLVNGGYRYRPNLVRKVIRGQDVEYIRPELIEELKLSSHNVETVKYAAQRVVEEDGGTGKRARVPGVLVGGKTGTAQVAALEHGIEGKLNDHAWFVSFAPVEKPSIVLSIIVENGGHGGESAAPIAQAIMQRYFIDRGVIEKPKPIELEDETITAITSETAAVESEATQG